MKKISLLLVFFALIPFIAMASGVCDTVIHPMVGTSVRSADRRLTVTLVGKKQSHSLTDTLTWDSDVRSPKSVNIHPNGQKYYVNSLEGAKTVVYATRDNAKLKVINHQFDESDSLLWAAPSGWYEFTHYTEDLNTFKGKPVESAFTHNGRYLWVTYYRRSYDINAQDPSALAVIDTETDSIVRLMETGPLPKMVAVDNDNNCYVAITHWGDNTVGIAVIDDMVDGKSVVSGWKNCKVGTGARTIDITPDGRYVLAVCNYSSRLMVVDTETMRVVVSIAADSYPVGLDISDDGRYVYTTSQGRSSIGGNCVDIYRLDYGGD